ncbi:ankyrin repeat domain-containing protein [Chitinophaga japonensis]|uniref:Ankyrin repeat protein n=1 Tax=Chitinophaga japonensis TaxID=104662 RepID=A0A562T573_CHIJA|nr:ankyrin repeat domain-containing protein [Chitinophaga japonensis]TWI88523.1 ankyrin repeat protein [Chitinophaga japonensis]
MIEVNTLAEALNKGLLDEARKQINQGQKLPKDLPSHQKRNIYDRLLQSKAFDIVHALTASQTIETDLYEYEKLDGSVFESIFRNTGAAPADLEFLASFLEKIDNVNDAVNNQTLLELAFTHSVPLEQIRVLADAGCDIHYKDNYEESYLHKIIKEYSIKEETGVGYLDYLLGQGLDPNAGNIVRKTPLHEALERNKQKYVELLLQQGADPNQPGKDGETAFYIAIVHQVCDAALYEKMAQYAPPDFDIANKDGETVLCGALRMRRNASEAEVRLVKALIRDGADIYQTSLYYNKDKAALDWVSEQPAGMLEGILETGVVDPDRRDNEGNTLLHKVCGYNVNYDQEAARQLYRKVKMLIAAGADVNISNDQDQRPVDLAAQDNLKVKTVELLLKHKA